MKKICYESSIKTQFSDLDGVVEVTVLLDPMRLVAAVINTHSGAFEEIEMGALGELNAGVGGSDCGVSMSLLTGKGVRMLNHWGI